MWRSQQNLQEWVLSFSRDHPQIGRLTWQVYFPAEPSHWACLRDSSVSHMDGICARKCVCYVTLWGAEPFPVSPISTRKHTHLTLSVWDPLAFPFFPIILFLPKRSLLLQSSPTCESLFTMWHSLCCCRQWEIMLMPSGRVWGKAMVCWGSWSLALM